MNRRDFTFLLGASFVKMALPKKQDNTNELGTVEHHQLSKAREFWLKNTGEKPEVYLMNQKINQNNFKTINQNELKNGKLLEFQGVYFSYCELALIASLASISV